MNGGLPFLAARRPVIGVEQQGHGRTGGHDAPMSLDAMRADTLAVLDALDVERVHAVGFSMGGMLALDLGVFAPEELATLAVPSLLALGDSDFTPVARGAHRGRTGSARTVATNSGSG
ncbi:alpha/beta fold hydrolase [Pseudooceanicola marinus]|uniref:alpha/beta fold hydrolase n=1 Tax=Pseudooceanicola marinus TaxID=396013 RepID=UPI000A26A919|nr:alpha/beta fold hydrolase [Pseudooceanicola marinus]PJE27316.1 hypothetical protein CVM50_16830 [Pseudooceanicola marinus]